MTGTNNSVGGLMGGGNGSISNSYANVSVSGGNTGAGGLKGSGSGNVSNSYATGNVSGLINAGGLVGQQSVGGTISNSYSTGTVTGTNFSGGLTGGASSIGNVAANVSNSYWNTSGFATSNGGTGLTTAQMKAMTSFNTWSIANSGGSAAVWRIYEGASYPLLASFLTPLTVTANAATATYSGTGYSGGNGVAYSIASPTLSGTVAYSGTSQGAINVGSYVITPSGYWSNQQGYDITYADGALTVNKAAATVTANSGSVTYNGQLQSVSGFTASGLVNGETVAVLGGVSTTGGSGTNAANYTHSASGTDGNYTLSFVDGTLTVNKAALTVTANAASKIYDGLAYSGGNGVGYNGFVNGETAAVLGGALAYSGTSQGAVDSGSYLITPSGLTSGNYAISFVDGTYAIAKAPLTVTANDALRTYDGIAWSGGNGVNYVGFVNGEGASALGGTLAWGGSAQGAVNAGSYFITPGGLTSFNYAIAFNDGTLTIGQRIPALPGAPADSYAGATGLMAGTASNAFEDIGTAVLAGNAANEGSRKESAKLSPGSATGSFVNQYVLVTQGCGQRLPDGLSCQ